MTQSDKESLVAMATAVMETHIVSNMMVRNLAYLVMSRMQMRVYLEKGCG